MTDTHQDAPQIDPRIASAIKAVFLIAMLVAPLIAWLFRIEYGLAVMAFTLGAVTWLLRDAARSMQDPRRASLLRTVAILTGLLAVLAIALLMIGLTVG